MATTLEDYLKMSAQDRQGVESIARPIINTYQKNQLPQFTQDVRSSLPAGMTFSPDQVQAAMDKASPSYTALSTDPERQRADAQIRSAQITAMRDPSYAGSPEAQRAGLGLATSKAQQTMNPLGQAASAYTPGTAAPTSSGPAGPAGPAVPAGPRGPSIYDMERGLLDRTFASQLEGFGDSRDLVEQLADMREKNIAGQEEFSRDRAAGRETFLEETDELRKANAAQAKENREQRKTHELARQQTQLDAALRASGIDKNAASSRLSALGIDPGNFADADMSETTAMLYSQNMSAASFVNQMDGVAEQAAEFAKNANDQAGAAALFGIGEDLSFALQSYDEARNQGLIDDAQAMYGIAAAERQARQAQDTALTTLDVNTKRAAQAAAAAAANRAAQKAEAEEMMAAGVISTQAIMKLRAGESLTSEEYMAIEMVNRSDDAVSASGSYVDFQTDERRRLEDDEQAFAMEGYKASLRPEPAAEKNSKVPVALATGQVVYLSPAEAISLGVHQSEYTGNPDALGLTQYFTPYQPPAEG